MVGKREYAGIWWLPGDERQKLSGTLTANKGASTLALIGHFGHQVLSETETETTYSFDLAEVPRIVGLTTGGDEITLEENGAVSHTESIPGISAATYRQNVALIGKQFSDGEEICFDEISVRASDLDVWTQVSGFEAKIGMERHPDKDYDVFSNVEVRFDAPDDIEIPLARGEEAFIRFNAPSKGIAPGTQHVALTQEAAIHLRFTKAVTLERVFQQVGEIRNFLSLAVARPVAILSVTGYQHDYVREQTQTRHPIELLWEIPHNPDPPVRERYPWEMLFTLPEAMPRISDVMTKWFAKQTRLQPVFNLFFGMRHHPDVYLDVRFLSYAQAVETYDYRRRRNAGNRSLAERMSEVLGECRTVSKAIVGAETGDETEVIESFKNSRNYYTHYNPKLERKAARGDALLLLCIQLEAIIEMSLLRELGFHCRSIDEIFQRARRYARIAHVKAIIAREPRQGGLVV